MESASSHRKIRGICCTCHDQRAARRQSHEARVLVGFPSKVRDEIEYTCRSVPVYGYIQAGGLDRISTPDAADVGEGSSFPAASAMLAATKVFPAASETLGLPEKAGARSAAHLY